MGESCLDCSFNFFDVYYVDLWLRYVSLPPTHPLPWTPCCCGFGFFALLFLYGLYVLTCVQMQAKQEKCMWAARRYCQGSQCSALFLTMSSAKAYLALAPPKGHLVREFHTQRQRCLEYLLSMVPSCLVKEALVAHFRETPTINQQQGTEPFWSFFGKRYIRRCAKSHAVWDCVGFGRGPRRRAFANVRDSFAGPLVENKHMLRLCEPK